jgi:hypothetical protein
MKEIGKFLSFPKAFKAVYDAVHRKIADDGSINASVLGTIWFTREECDTPIYFDEAKDMMYKMGYMANGEWVGAEE